MFHRKGVFFCQERLVHAIDFVRSHCSSRYWVVFFLFVSPAIFATIMTDNQNVGLRVVVESTDQFANNFFKTVAKGNPGNLITSPLSAQVVLAMVAYGARGTTATQMRSTLRLPSDDKLAQSGYQSLIEILNATKGVELSLANKIYTAIHAAIKPAYKELTATKFCSSSQEVDFSDTKRSANIINAWCEQQTNNRIKDLIDADSLSADTMVVLVNAVYFKGQWENKFDPAHTHKRPFHVNKTSTIHIPTMFIGSKLRLGNLPELGARFAEIPYQGGDISMVIILPNEINGLGRVQDNLHQVNLSRSLQQSHPTDVDLFLPKFKIESTLDLKVTLENLGMTDMFKPSANLSGIADISLKVSKVVQKAFIEVNEEGSEAAAATGVQIMTLSMRENEVFNVNRPFYYQIRSKAQNVPLFAGIYRAQ